jgi:small-conductance mechanosensitive channel
MGTYGPRTTDVAVHGRAPGVVWGREDMTKDNVLISGKESIRLNTWVQVVLLLVFLALSAAAWTLDRAGIGLGTISPQRNVAFFLCLVFASAAVYELAALAIHGIIHAKHGSAGEVKMLRGFARVVMILVVIVSFIYSTGTLQAIGAVVGAFAGLLLGWSLQAPVSGIAAWALVTIKRPFRLGDRVLFPSLALLGDVLEIGLMYTKLDQVGGSVGSEESIGRNILIPNAMLFSQVAINYTPQHLAAYFLDEVVIRLTYDSDWDKAEQILLSAAKEVTADIIRQTGKQPYIRSDIYDYGVYMRLRYMTAAMDRPRMSHEILKRIFLEFQRDPRVDFAIPFLYSYRKGMEMASRSSMGPEPVAEVGMDGIDDPQDGELLSEEDQEGIRELARRIQKMGLLQPVVVGRTAVGRYELLAGRFRLLACRQLGWKVIPAIIRISRLPSAHDIELPG